MLEHIVIPIFFAHVLNQELPVSAAPVKNPEAVSPVLSAESVLAYDLTSGVLLFQKNIFEKRPMASIGKLVTAMVILDNHKLNEKLTVSKNAASMESSKIWLLPNEELTVESALFGLLIHSGNDAAMALAEFDSGNEELFVKKLNKKAHEVGLDGTNFTNAVGFDTKDHYSTAYDIMLMSIEALKYDFIKKAVAIPKMEIRSTNGRLRHKIESTNQLLNDPNFKIHGIKTGKTEGAGPSFVALAQGPDNHEIITVVLGSNDRFQETKILLNWLSRAYQWN